MPEEQKHKNYNSQQALQRKKLQLTLHWQYGGAMNIFSAFVLYSASVSADE
jgi:hypothetical protein